jgi:hypothetical protein
MESAVSSTYHSGTGNVDLHCTSPVEIQYLWDQKSLVVLPASIKDKLPLTQYIDLDF